ncbi:MAG TPA: endo alpha-1,4 polygalactosaminidase, partial [Polyangiaceae bacterium]|nr:endo alpha-1,4 polygalactosaminidase [Polyangiaceae bacterium]
TCAACTGALDPQSGSERDSNTSSDPSSTGGVVAYSKSAAGGSVSSAVGSGGATRTAPRTDRVDATAPVAGGAGTAGSAPKVGNTSSVMNGGNTATADSSVPRGGSSSDAASARGGDAPSSITERGGSGPSSFARGGSTAKATASTQRGGAPNSVGGATAGGTTQATGSAQGGATVSTATPTRRLPEANAPFDYQIGGAYTPPAGVKIVSRDRKSQPATGLYNICYVNGFQSQPDEESFWKEQHPELLLRNASGAFVVDEDWGEYLLDTSTADKRKALGTIVGGWIKQCAKDGFDAIEVDNLDSYSRSGGVLSQSQNVAMMRILSDVAHESGLAVAQKNSTELLGEVTAMGTDFAVAEECNRWDECGDYQQAYGNRVYVIEYRAADFKAGCTAYPGLSIVLRDLNVSTPSSGSYVFEGC